jgi:hypothetical protein
VGEPDARRSTRARGRVRLLAILSTLAFGALLLTDPGSGMAWARLAGLALSVAILAVVTVSPGGRRRPPGDGA